VTLSPGALRLVDEAGRSVPLRGLNMTHAWGDLDRSVATIPHLARTGANCVRAAFGTFPHSCGKAPAIRERVTREYVDAGLTPIVEDHDATCRRDLASLRAVVDAWLDAGNLRWLDELREYVVLNIANEWGPADERWCAGYIESIARLRDAGVRNALLIDAPGCGQEIGPVVEFGKDVFLADPLGRTAFSVHLYKRWHTEGGAGPLLTIDTFTALREASDVVRSFGSDLIAGEFSSSEFVGGRYDDARLIDVFEELRMGWLAWSWNQNDARSLDMATDWQLEDDARDLTEFGKRVVRRLRRDLNRD
jgi:mannan endo-1,4-beta-mannosidase